MTFKNFSNTTNFFSKKSNLIILGSLTTLSYGYSRFIKKDKNDNKKDNKKDNEEKNEININDSLSETRHININQIKNQLEISINSGSISELEQSLEILEGIISGYQVLIKKSIDHEYNLENTLYKLNKYKIKSYYNLACLYLNNSDYNKANYYLIKSIDVCDSKDCSHHKYIKNIFSKLQKTNFLI